MFLMGNRAFTDTRPARWNGPKIHDLEPGHESGPDQAVDRLLVARMVAEASSLQPTWAPVVPDDSGVSRIVGPGAHRHDGNRERKDLRRLHRHLARMGGK